MGPPVVVVEPSSEDDPAARRIDTIRRAVSSAAVGRAARGAEAGCPAGLRELDEPDHALPVTRPRLQQRAASRRRPCGVPVSAQPDQVRQVEVADGDRVGVARARATRPPRRSTVRCPRTVSSRRRASSIGRSAPSCSRRATTAARAPCPRAPPRRRRAASPRPGPSRQRRGGRRHPQRRAEPGRARASRAGSTSRRHAALASRPTTFCSRIAGTSASSTLPDRGIRSAGQAAVRVADHRVQRRVEPVAGRRGRRAGRDVPASARSAPGPHAVTCTPSAAPAQVPRRRTVRRQRRLPDRPVRREPPRRVAAAAPQAARASAGRRRGRAGR